MCVACSSALDTKLPRGLLRLLLLWSLLSVATAEMFTALMRAFFDTELHAVVASLDTSSCLGEDGLLRQFFLKFSGVLHASLLYGLQHIFYSGSMHPSMCSGLIALIPKGGIPRFSGSGTLVLCFPLCTKAWPN